MSKITLWRALSWSVLFCAVMLWGIGVTPALAQAAELTLSVRKNMGFNNGSQIQGSFRVQASGPENLTSVTFTIDGQILGTASAAPFRVNFETDSYAPGWHTIGATGQTADGQTLTAVEKRFQFLSSAQATASMQTIVLPLVSIIALLVFGGMGLSLFSATRGKNQAALPLGAARQYGLLGGAICPKCQRPFSLHWWSLNAGIFQKLDRCGHCGKWSLVRPASREALAAAEAAEVQQAQPETPIAEMSAEEKLKRDLDASRFLDH